MPQQQPSDVSMRDLLASCAAASAVSTPPRQAPAEERAERDEAAGGTGPEEQETRHAA
ncbi:hypothetical protein ACFPM3_29850 [Streptomyces coeruleoprunus]|uniref:Uncharacterized protein n=1 Tax=Streptomyces coeruleoprunus TaxID=285563 RepID=A0ABV9XPP3_9ACTN